MKEQDKNQNKDPNANNGGNAENEQRNSNGGEQQPEGGKDGKNAGTGSHDEGQYQEGNDKPTMSPGSSEAEVNPSAKKH